jgi:hypothetical protein
VSDLQDEERLNAEKLDVLGRWGSGLASDPRDEVRAAGKAISLLIEEIERLHVELWHARDKSEPPVPPAAADDPPVDNIAERLLARVRWAFSR